MSGSVLNDDELREHLDRWVAEGLISRDQEHRIEVAESARQRAQAEPTSRVPLAVEALGYLGGLLAVVAGVIAVGQLWHDIPPGAEMAFAASGALVTLLAGGWLRGGLDPAIDRLRSVLWALSVGCVAAFMGLLGHYPLDLGDSSTVLLAAATATGYATLLWLRSAEAIQHLAMFAGLEVTVGALLTRIDGDLMPVWVGAAVWAVAALWGISAYHGYVGPMQAGYLSAAVAGLVGAMMTFEAAAGPAFALVTVGLILLAGVLLRELPLLAVGAVGVVMVLPQAATRYLPDTLAAPLAIFAVGVLLLGIAVWLVRRPRVPTA